MSTTTKHLLSAVATAVFAIAATATTVTNAFAAEAAGASAPAAKSVKVAAPAGKTRAEVQAEYLAARKNGTLLQTEADFDVAQTRKHVVQH
ncbi:hypothetical protein FHW58_003472 [Duganella sp. 1224]|uniref:DUF4148 domain-containing protein n=1 Tax=Duganella sp. 1224 TaxID=2587052 RepID=UPI0015CCE63A|nr:DUF4148 domain-containing protein [Duganella sp. 1224]NYE62257.1 hypothetical protein [Duganella sp. 1224]